MTAAAAGLILAAGAGTRFGPEPKLLARLDHRPVLQHVVDAMEAVAELDPIVVVLGAHRDRVRAGVHFGRSRAIVCQEWAAGLSASLRCGVAALPAAERVLIALGDGPGLQPAAIRRLLGSEPGARACYHGVPGHPVLLGLEQLAQLDELRGDVGARELLVGAAMVECGDLGSGVDVDTPGDLERLSKTIGEASAQ